ncbi:MAG: hypothetical protein RSB71_01660 [Bacilli bacterium]
MKKTDDIVSQIALLLQIVLGIFVLTFAIASLFERELFIICEILIGLLMFVIAYNNQKIYKRKYMTVVYIGLGIVIITSSLFA